MGRRENLRIFCKPIREEDGGCVNNKGFKAVCAELSGFKGAWGLNCWGVFIKADISGC